MSGLVQQKKFLFLNVPAEGAAQRDTIYLLIFFLNENFHRVLCQNIHESFWWIRNTHPCKVSPEENRRLLLCRCSSFSASSSCCWILTRWPHQFSYLPLGLISTHSKCQGRKKGWNAPFTQRPGRATYGLPALECAIIWASAGNQVSTNSSKKSHRTHTDHVLHTMYVALRTSDRVQYTLYHVSCTTWLRTTSLCQVPNDYSLLGPSLPLFRPRDNLISCPVKPWLWFAPWNLDLETVEPL